MSLFNDPYEKINLQLKGADVVYFPNFLPQEEAFKLFDTLLKSTQWQQDDICVYGKTYPQPRLTHLFADNQKPYSYSNITMYPTVFPDFLLKIKQQIEVLVKTNFTTCLANLYRNGQDSNGWHSDNEKELGVRSIIASLSLGEARWFHLRHKEDKTLKSKIELINGSLLVMKGETQNNWLHQIPKTKKSVDQRINLTFRVIK